MTIFKSRKFWTAFVALFVIVLRGIVPDFPISDEQMTEIVYVLIAYIVGVALEKQV